MREEIIQLMAEILKKETDGFKTELEDKDSWDSLTRVEIMFAIEDEYGITFEEEELQELDTPQKFIDCAIKKVKS